MNNIQQIVSQLKDNPEIQKTFETAMRIRDRLPTRGARGAWISGENTKANGKQVLINLHEAPSWIKSSLNSLSNVVDGKDKQEILFQLGMSLRNFGTLIQNIGKANRAKARQILGKIDEVLKGEASAIDLFTYVAESFNTIINEDGSPKGWAVPDLR